jgi:hypothetical protein
MGKATITATHSCVEAVILCLDSAKHNSGAGILIHAPTKTHKYHLHMHATITSQRDRALCVQELYKLSHMSSLPPVICREDWTPGFKSFKAILGMGEGLGRWTAEFERVAEMHQKIMPPAFIFSAYPKTWRAGVLGNANADKEEAVRFIKAVLGIDLPHDEAESICVGFFGAQQKDVHAGVEQWLKKKTRLLKKSQNQGL